MKTRKSASKKGPGNHTNGGSDLELADNSIESWRAHIMYSESYPAGWRTRSPILCMLLSPEIDE